MKEKVKICEHCLKEKVKVCEQCGREFTETEAEYHGFCCKACENGY